MADAPRVIIVDDEPGLRDMVAEYLGKHGMAVRVADGGPALDRCLAEGPADLLLLDVNMPGEDGFTVARRLRAAGDDVAIIMVTAADDVIDRVVGLEIGADDYVTKPFDLRELRARMRSVLRRGRSTPPRDETRADDARLAESPGDARPVEWPGEPGARVRFGAMTLDRVARRLLAPDGSALPSTCSPRIPTACSAATGCSIWRTTARSSRSTARSTSGSRVCGARSRPIPPSPRSSRRCAAPATCS